ncbi:ISAs1 family transposase [Prevotella lacticifex]|uniref:ISAs1 family transposase n=1 Tax=Prevotella lacticifex TaxID=2854755 RepID=UPI001CC57210|nr:ISAs1 family transposase [Prevotella lacticifex]
MLNFIHSVPDYRRMNKGNCKHKLSDMLLLVILARACGCETRKDIVAFGTIHLSYLQDHLGILAKGCPSEPTLCRMEGGIDDITLASLVSTLSRKYVSEHDGANRRHIAIDGKFMLGTKIGDGRSPDVVTAFSVTDRLPLDTEMCEVKSNEIKAVPKIIERADYMNGCVITADAMSCQSSIIKGIVGKGADYLIALKANQKAARWSVEDAVPTLHPNDEWKTEWELAHGRLYQRRCRVYSDISGIKALEKFLNVKAVIAIDTHTIEKKSGTEQKQTRYYITSLEERAQTLDRISRMHWGIENNLHWTLDARMRQDRTKRKETKSARNLDSIQKLVYIIYTIASKKHLPETIRKRKELFKVKFSAIASYAKNSLAYAISLLSL